MRLCSLIIFFCSFLAFITEAKEVRLFEADGTQAHYYDAHLNYLKPGDVLIFDHDIRYEFNRYLGSGLVSTILEVKPLNPAPLDVEKESITALRLPKSHNMNPKNGIRFPTLFLHYSIEEYPKLIQEKVPVPPVYRMVDQQYIEMKLQHPEFDLNGFFTHGRKLPPDQQSLVLDKLAEFAKKTAHFRKIGDFKADQIIFDSKLQEWILLDFSVGSKLITEKSILQKLGFPASSIFRLQARYLMWENNLIKNKRILYSPFQRNILRTISSAVKEERKTLGYRSGICDLNSFLNLIIKRSVR